MVVVVVVIVVVVVVFVGAAGVVVGGGTSVYVKQRVRVSMGLGLVHVCAHIHYTQIYFLRKKIWWVIFFLLKTFNIVPYINKYKLNKYSYKFSLTIFWHTNLAMTGIDTSTCCFIWVVTCIIGKTIIVWQNILIVKCAQVFRFILLAHWGKEKFETWLFTYINYTYTSLSAGVSLYVLTQ